MFCDVFCSFIKMHALDINGMFSDIGLEITIPFNE